MTEIKINELESYNFSCPEKMSKQQFSEFVMRLNHIHKVVYKGDDVLDMVKRSHHKKEEVLQPYQKITIDNTNPITFDRAYSKQLKEKIRSDKNFCFELYKAHYDYGKIGRKQFCEKHKINFNCIEKTIFGGDMVKEIREHHKFKPSEFGLIRFPTKHEQIKDLRIKQN